MSEAGEILDRPEPAIRSPFIEHLGMEFRQSDSEEVEVLLPIRPELLNSVGVVHGGVYASLADTVLGAAIYTRVPREQIALTVELSCRYLRAAREGVLHGRGRVVHLGRRTVVAEADISVDGVMQVKASGTFMLMPREEASGAGRKSGRA